MVRLSSDPLPTSPLSECFWKFIYFWEQRLPLSLYSWFGVSTVAFKGHSAKRHRTLSGHCECKPIATTKICSWSNQKRVFDSVLDWFPSLEIILGPLGVAKKLVYFDGDRVRSWVRKKSNYVLRIVHRRRSSTLEHHDHWVVGVLLVGSLPALVWLPPVDKRA